MMYMRRSKFKHVFGKPVKKESCYEDIRITKSSLDNRFCVVNPKYIAIITESGGGGAFLVIPIEKVGRVPRDHPMVTGHKAAVCDLQWCPHNDDVIASASDDTTVKVWQIPEGGLEAKTNLETPVADLALHQRRVCLVHWHPTAEHVLLSAGADNLVIIWNVGTEEPLVEITLPDMLISVDFNYNGSRLVTTCKDRHTRVLDARSGDILAQGICHHGTKPQQAVYLKDEKIFTTGFSPMSDRQYGLWDDKNLEEPLHLQDLDISNGVIFPFYDGDNNLMYLCGKGDSTIRYFEITDEEPYVHYLNMLTSSDPQRGMGWMPKRGLDVNQCEIARFYKLHQKGLCEIIPFFVPRKSELFQDDLYPDTVSDTPAMTADEWMDGKDTKPILMSLKEGYIPKQKHKAVANALGSKAHKGLSRSSVNESQRSRLEVRNRDSTLSASSASDNAMKEKDTNNEPDAQLTASTNLIAQLSEDIRKIKLIIKGHEKRIKQLETNPSLMDGDTLGHAE